MNAAYKMIQLFLLLGVAGKLFAMPTVSRCEIVPAILSPEQKVVVVVEGEGITSGSATLDLTALGGEAEQLVFELAADGSGGMTAMVELADDLDFSLAAEVGLSVVLEDGVGGRFEETKEVPLSLTAMLPEGVSTSVVPRQLGPGSTFTVMAMGANLQSGAVAVDFGSSSVQWPLSFEEGGAMVSGMVPQNLEVPTPTILNILVDLEDVAGNRYRVVEEAGLAQTASEAPPVVSDVTVMPNPIQAGEEFTVTVTGQGASNGVVLADFRPHIRSVLRLPLTSFTGESASATGIAPATLPADLVDVMNLKTILLSPSGDQRAIFDQVVAVSAVPLPLDLAVSILEPQPSSIVVVDDIEVSGLVGEDISEVTINGEPAVITNGRYAATIELREGVNDLSVVGIGSDESVNSESVSITRDTTGPILNIEIPSDGAVLTQPQVTVAGFVNDLVAGTINESDVEIEVNGVRADVRNRSYEVQEFALVPGLNALTVTATDRAGNSNSQSIEVEFRNEALQQNIQIASGNNQEGLIGSVLADPLVVEVVDRDGVAIPGVPLTFEVTRGDGALLAGGTESSQIFLRSDEEGQAEVLYILGSRSGEGNNRVQVTSPGFVGEVVFCVSGIGTGANRITALQPAIQVGEVGRVLPEPFQALVLDSGGNPVDEALVRFRVISGGGTIFGQEEIQLRTNSSGRIAVSLSLGEESGSNVHRIVADLPEGPNEENAIFSASGLVPGASEDTSLVGIVLDSGNLPVPGATAHIEGTDLSVITDEEGQFRIENCPVGAIQLSVDGSTTTRPGVWPELEFDLVTIAGEENSVDRPVYLLELDEDETLVGGDEDVTLTLDGVPGAELTIFANSVTGLNGEEEVAMRWTQVNLERVPMAPPLGSQFMLALTLQPSGVVFDPPARLQIPNMGSPPGQQVEMFSFDHDLGEFVSLGTATVSEDGSVQISDAGFGLIESGWHGCAPPPPPCRPWEGDPPMDTPCRKWEAIPPSDECEYTRYEPNDARIVSLDATVNGMPSDRIFSGETAGFVAIGRGEFHDGIEFEWDPGDGSGTVTGATFSHQYMEEGTFTATVTAMCTGCPTATQTASVTVEVFEDKIVTVQDSNNRIAQGGLLQVVTPTYGETIRAQAEFEGGEVPPGRPVWQAPGGEQTGEEITFRVDADDAGLGPIPIFGTIPLPLLPPERFEVTCDDGTTTRIEAWSNESRSLSLRTDVLENFVRSFERINDFFPMSDPDASGTGFQFLRGNLTFMSQWQECPTNNQAFWTWGVSGGFNPLFSAEYSAPLGGPAVQAFGWLAELLGAQARVEGFINGSFSLQGNFTRNNCGVISGAIPISGGVTIGIRAELGLTSDFMVMIVGSSGITAGGNLSITDQAVNLNQAQVTWNGISATVTVTVVDALFGGFFDVEVNRQWNPVDPINFHEPIDLPLIQF